jgi:hypothetical protein
MCCWGGKKAGQVRFGMAATGGNFETGESSVPADSDGDKPKPANSTDQNQEQDQTLVAQEEDPELVPRDMENDKGEIDPNAEAERALEPVEPEPATPPAAQTPEDVLSQHSASDIQAVRNGACSVDPQLEGAIRQKDIFDSISNGGFKVTNNPLGPNQESNVTITSPLQPGVKLNLRVETHPVPGSGGQPVRHFNVELVTPRTGTTPKLITNTHIIQ